jgi:2,4-dienoyl-CoA reductase-like NADH-dependent reductase (Old Yellow Enzyme family)
LENIPSTTKSSPKFIINSSNDIIWLKCRWNNLRRRKWILIRATNVGLYILGATCTSLEGLAFDNQPRAFDDKDIPSNAERVKIVKGQGALAINQIHHGGCLGLKRLSAEVFNKELEKKWELNDDTKAVELTGDEIKRIINDFAKATEISIKAGYGGIEIHGANNYLLQQFYSGYYNKRTDE